MNRDGVATPPSPKRPATAWVKLCGVTRVRDALAAVDLGVDMIGFNFYPPSPRFLSPEAAERLATALSPSTVTKVGVFVDASPEAVAAAVASYGLDLVQFHGSESPAVVEALGVRAIKAFRVDGALDPDEVRRYPLVWGFLFDRYDAVLKGGTGHPWRFETMRDFDMFKPTLVAGGIRPENVRDALERSGAWGVDVCSGVESAPGVKDHGRLETLMREVKDG